MEISKLFGDHAAAVADGQATCTFVSHTSRAARAQQKRRREQLQRRGRDPLVRFFQRNLIVTETVVIPLSGAVLHVLPENPYRCGLRFSTPALSAQIDLFIHRSQDSSLAPVLWYTFKGGAGPDAVEICCTGPSRRFMSGAWSIQNCLCVAGSSVVSIHQIISVPPGGVGQYSPEPSESWHP